MNDRTSSVSGPGFPVLSMVGSAYRSVVSGASFLPAAFAVPLLLFLAAYGVQDLYDPRNPYLDNRGFYTWPRRQTDWGLHLVSLFALVIQSFAISLLYVAWHRLILLGPVDGRPRFFFQIGSEHMRFFGRFLLASPVCALLYFSTVWGFVFLAVPGATFSASAKEISLTVTSPWIALALAVLLAVIVVRSFLIFPALSLDQDYGVAQAWRDSKSRTIRLLAGFVLCLAPTLFCLVVSELLYFWILLAGRNHPDVDFWRTAYAWSESAAYPVGVLNGLVLVSFLSFVFERTRAEYRQGEIGSAGEVS